MVSEQTAFIKDKRKNVFVREAGVEGIQIISIREYLSK